MARVLLALVLLAALVGCGQPNSPAERQEKEAGVEEAAKDREPVKTVQEPTTPETAPQEPEPEPAPEPESAEGPPKYSIEDVYIDKGGGPGSAATITVIAPDVERGEEAARLAAAEYAEHDYVMMALSASKADDDSYAVATMAFTERGAGWTGLEPGELKYEPE